MKKSNITNIGEDVEKLRLAHFAGGNVKWYSHFGKLQKCVIKLNNTLSYNQGIPFLYTTSEK